MPGGQSERLRRIEAQFAEQKGKLDMSCLLAKETRDELRAFRTDLFDFINPLKSEVSRHGESIKWIKRFVWVPITGFVGMIIQQLYEIVHATPK